VIALLATDGDPTECDTDLGHIDAIAATAIGGDPKIPTFVIGVGSSLTALNGIAAAGGTQKAFIVDPTQPNLNKQFLDALDSVRIAASGCHYPIPLPASGPINPSLINIEIKPAGGPAKVVPRIASAAACPATGDAWYYDDNAHPKHIVLCDATCKAVAATTGEEVDFLVGCDGVGH